MGEFLTKKYGDEMFSIGAFAAAGTYRGNYFTEEIMEPADSTSMDIKHIIEQLSGEVNYFSIPDKGKPGGEWLFDPITINDTFIDLSSSHKMILSKHFDALLLFQSVSMPE